MKNKAFTLLELLGVVIILGVLSLITFPIILNQIKNAKQGIKDSAKALIIDAAKDYYEDNTNNYDLIEGMTYCINVQTLTDNNYLNKNLKNENLNNIDTSKKVKLIYHNNKFNYEITDTCNNNSLTRNNIEVKVVTEGKGLYKSQTEPDRFIYRGGDEESSKVNNFITLKENGTDVTYRILSFESDGTIKVVRNAEISIDDKVYFSWDNAGSRITDNGNTYCNNDNSKGCHVWGNTSNTYSNGKTIDELNRNFYYEYYDSNAALKLSKTNEGIVKNDSTLNTLLNNEWYNELNIKNNIKLHEFSVGAIYYFGNYVGGDKGIKKEKFEESLLTWKGYIGLMNITEYVEASTNTECTSIYSNYYWNPVNETIRDETDRNKWPCSNQNYNWLSIGITEWFLSPYARDIDGVYYLKYTGYFRSDNAGSAYRIRPAFYLKSDISLTGEGTEANPYRIVGES